MRGAGEEAWGVRVGQGCCAGQDAVRESGLFVPTGGGDAWIGVDMGAKRDVWT